MKEIYLLQWGIGKVGSSLVRLIIGCKERIKNHLGLDFKYLGIADKSGIVFNEEALKSHQILSVLQNKEMGKKIKEVSSTKKGASFLLDFLKNFKKNVIFLEITSSDTTLPFIIELLKNNIPVITSNKKLLCSDYKKYKELMEISSKKGAFFSYETTVGAGLPVISTLNKLKESQDEIIKIEGVMSTTLSYAFNKAREGISFAKAVLEAKKLGYSEEDPREDLSAIDVKRKSLILARVLGYEVEIQDIKAESLILDEDMKIPLAEFLFKRLREIENLYEEKIKEAQKREKILTYSSIIEGWNIEAGLKEYDKFSFAGNLKEGDNLFMFKTKIYNKTPLTIASHGIGPIAAASSLLGEIISTGKQLTNEKSC